MDVALENAHRWAAEGATRKVFAKSLRQKDRVERLHDGESGCCSLFDFVFSEPEPFVGLAFFFVCTEEKGLEKS